MHRQDWVLAALACAKGKPLSPVQLQKTMFLLGKSYPDVVGGDYYKFGAHHYGPFSAAVYEDVEVMEHDGLTAVVSNGRYDQYSVTSKGLARGQALLEGLPDVVREYLQELVEWMRTHSFQQIVKAVYDQYPEYRANSVFRG